MARREVRSTGGAHGGVGEAIPWPEVPVCVEVLLGGNDEPMTRRRAEAGERGARGRNRG
jgi:hypothetical protein